MSQGITNKCIEMFYEFCNVLEQNKIDYVLLGNVNGYPETIDSDVDFMVSEASFKKLEALFSKKNALGSARLLQVLRHEISATYYVFGMPFEAGLACIALDACHDYRIDGQLWLKSKRVLHNKIKNSNGLWVPSIKDNFKYYLIKRVVKSSFDVEHLEYFQSLFESNEKACRLALEELFSEELSQTVEKAIQTGSLHWFQSNNQKLLVDACNHNHMESKLDAWSSKVKNMQRKWSRAFNPTGLVIAVLGPDGSGKSTIIDFVMDSIRDAFRKTQYYHLRPHFGKVNAGMSVANPHAQSPRPFFFGILKLILFTLDYWFGWLRFIWPKKVSSTLIVFDRYYHDMLVDSYRYRLPNNFRLTSVFELFIPKPDIWLVLTAPAQVLVDRKGEVSLSVAIEQVKKYEALQQNLKSAYLIDTNVEIEKTCEQVLSVLLSKLEKNALRQIKV